MNNTLAIQSSASIVDKAIYFGCSRPERKQIALRLAEWRLIRANAQAALGELIQGHLNLMLSLEKTGVTLSPASIESIQRRYEDQLHPLLDLARQPTPLSLLACGGCGRLVRNCTCTHEGQPLNWERA